MPQVYFHCSNPKEALIDRNGALAEARDHAACVVRSLTRARNLEDWRSWVLHVNDDLGDELLRCPLRFHARQAALKSQRKSMGRSLFIVKNGSRGRTGAFDLLNIASCALATHNASSRMQAGPH
jgi:hypothetical protein